MKKLIFPFLAIAFLLLSGQTTELFPDYVGNLPPAGSVNVTDQLYLLQAGVSKRASVSQVVIAGGGGGGGGVSVNVTRSQIPSTAVTATTITLNGYSTPNDLGNGCVYSTVNATANGLQAVTSLSGALYNLIFPNGVVNVGCLGAKADNGVTTISAGDIAANTQWRGTYTVGTTWDTVGNQEAKYAAYAVTSTPGVLHWNVDSGAKNLMFYVPSGNYGINRQIFSIENGGIDFFVGKKTTFWNWKGAANQDGMWLCDSCAYVQIFGMGVGGGTGNASISGNGFAPLIIFDHDGSAHGLSTQQVTFYDLVCNAGWQAICFAVNPVSGAGGQGDGITFINPGFFGFYSQSAIWLNGDNITNLTIIGGDCQGFWKACIETYGGTFETYGFRSELQTAFNDTSHAPIFNTIIDNGGGVFEGFGVANSIATIHNWRSEDSILLAGTGFTTNIETAAVLGADMTNGWPTSSREMAGLPITPGTNNAKARNFVVVDTGGTSWAPVTSVDGAGVITDNANTYSVNQWVGFDLTFRFNDNVLAFVEHCSITANTAHTITVSGGASCVTSGVVGLNSGFSYQINGKTGGSQPNWDAGATGFRTGYANQNGTNDGFVVVAGSNQVGTFGNINSNVSVNDWILIPAGDILDPGGGNLVTSMPLYAKITAKSGVGCQGAAACLTISKNAGATVGSAGAGAFGYYCTPVIDNNVSWCDAEFEAIHAGGSLNNIQANHGLIGGGVTAGSTITSGGGNDNGKPFVGGFTASGYGGAVAGTGYNIGIDPGFTVAGVATLTSAASIDFSLSALGFFNQHSARNFYLKPSQNMTINAPALPNSSPGNGATYASDINFILAGDNTNDFVITWGTNFDTANTASIPFVMPKCNCTVTIKFYWDAGINAWRIQDISGSHPIVAPPVANTCTGYARGTGGTDYGSNITFNSATTCSVTFGSPFKNAPACTISPGSAASTTLVTATTTGLSATFGTAQTGMSWNCVGN